MQKLAILLLFTSMLLLGCISGGATSESTPAAQASATAVVSVSATATVVTSTPTATATSSPSQVASPAPSEIPSPTATEMPSVEPSPSPTPSVVEVQMVMKKFSFQPEQVKVKQGDLVKLVISVPSGDTTHGIAIPEFGVSQTVSPGETKTVEFTASKAGTFSFSCNVFCGSGHRDMKFTVFVE